MTGLARTSQLPLVTEWSPTDQFFLWQQGATKRVLGSALFDMADRRRYPTLLDPPSEDLPPALVQAKPSLGVPVRFGDYETVVVRLTDDGKRHPYATRPAFSADQTKVFLAGYPYRVVDLLGGQVGDTISGEDIDFMQLGFWDTINPNLLWGADDGGSSVCCYNIDTEQFRSWTIPGAYDETIIGGGEGSIDNNGRYIPLISTKNGNTYVTIWDAQEEDVEGTLTLTGWHYKNDIDNVMISQSGQYIIVYSERANEGGFRIYDRATLNYLRSYYGGSGLNGTTADIGHADVGYRSDGTECILTQNTSQDIVTVSLLDASERVEISGDHFGFNMHLSCQSRKRPGYGYISMVSNSANAADPLYRYIYAVKLDGQGMIEMFGESMFNESTNDYNWEAHACPSPYGDIVVMGSVWQGSSPDTYILYVPETMPI